MNKMVSMKMPKKPKKEMSAPGVSTVAEQDEYPYNLRVTLDSEQLAVTKTYIATAGTMTFTTCPRCGWREKE